MALIDPYSDWSYFDGVTAPLTFTRVLPGGGLSDDERDIATYLSSRLFTDRYHVRLAELYYEGLQAVTSLGISTPPELEGLRTIMGWAQTGVDAIEERLRVQGFRMPGSNATSDDLWSIWQDNDLDDEQTHVHRDSLIARMGAVIVGPGDDNPVITVESPRNITAAFDPRQRAARAAYQEYLDVDPTSDTYRRVRVALYLPDSTIHMTDTVNGWEVVDRDDHGMGVVPVVPFMNNRGSGRGVGRSEITPAWRNTIDRACRAGVRLEVSSEFFAAPKMIILGAAESDFQKADGTPKTAWETYIGRVLGLTPDPDTGDMPKVERFASEAPDGLIKVIDHQTKVMAGLTGLPPQYLGIFSDGNPASADAIRMSDYRLKMKADRKTVTFGNCWEQVMRLAWLIRDGEIPDGATRIETDWASTGVPTPAADTDAVTKQIASGMLAPTSDVGLSRLGYTAVERSRIAAENRKQANQESSQALLSMLQTPPPADGPAPGGDDVAGGNDAVPQRPTPLDAARANQQR